MFKDNRSDFAKKYMDSSRYIAKGFVIVSGIAVLTNAIMAFFILKAVFYILIWIPFFMAALFYYHKSLNEK